MKTALIIGGSRGIGAGTAELFLERGWAVAVCARTEGEAVPELRRKGAVFFPCDITREEEAEQLRDRVLGLFHHLDALIYCAGNAWHGLLQDMSTPAFDSLVDTHLRGAFFALRAFLPSMLECGAGSILLVSSMWGQAGAACEAAYSAVKGGQIALVKALAKECGPSGIRVNALCPGYVDTAMNRDYPPEVKEQMMEQTPLGRLCTVRDCAEAAYFLCSGEASFVTGQVLGVSGGMVL